jgi:hypothetical protein
MRYLGLLSLLMFFMPVAAYAIGGGALHFEKCENKYEICRDVEQFFEAQHFIGIEGFFISALGSGGEIKYIQDDQPVFVILADSMDACQKKDCLLLYLTPNGRSREVGFSSMTSGTVVYKDFGGFVKEGWYVGLGYSVKWSSGYLFYEYLADGYKLTKMLVESQNK